MDAARPVRKAKAVFAFVFVCVCVRVTDGHEIAVPKIDRVVVSTAGVRVQVEYAIDPRRSEDLRRIYDRNRSGTLDEIEREPLQAWLRLVATRHLALTVDGRRLGLVEERAAFEGLEGQMHATFVLGTGLAVAPGRHELAVRDRDRDAAVRVPVTIEFVKPLAAAPGAATSAMLDGSASSLAVPFRAP